MAQDDVKIGESGKPVDAVGGLKVAGSTVISAAGAFTGNLTGNVTGNLDGDISAELIASATETIAAGGTSTALDLTKVWHHLDADAGGDTFTVADGTTGQIIICTMESATGTATITPANLAGGTSVTFNAAGDSVILGFIDAQWYILGGNSYAVV